jgi:hypothetical protein
VLSFKKFIKESIVHPKLGEHGESVYIENPSNPSPIEHWHDSTKHATVVPNGEIPQELNGVKFESWKNSPKNKEEWNSVEGQGDFEEPPLINTNNKRIATGAIIHEKDGRVWTLSPTNGFGGYDTTIGPKGKLDSGLNHRANAIKEAHEETGLKIELLGHAHDSNRSTSLTRYYHAKRVGGTPSEMGWESQAVHLVPKEKLKDHLNSPLDKEIVEKL